MQPIDSDKQPTQERGLETRLVLLAQAGDAGAFRALAELHVVGLLRGASAMGCDRNSAEDLAQETLLEAWRSLGRYDGTCRLGTWLFGILRNRFLKSLRRRKLVFTDELTRLAGSTMEGGPVQAVLQDELAGVLREAVAELPDGQREVIELRFFGGASLQEIAVLLDCPLGTVKSRLHHGLEKLRQQRFD